MMMLPVLFLFVLTIIGLSSCNNELIKRQNLACEELCEGVLQKFFSNESKSISTDSIPEKEQRIVKHNQKNVANLNQYLETSSIIFALSKEANKKTLNEQCFKDFKTIEKGILEKDPWAMKVRDSSGEKESGFIWGNNYWLGSRLGCAAVQNPVQITLSDQIVRIMNKDLIKQMAPFQMDYRVVYLKHNSPWQVDINMTSEAERTIHVGLCLPSACSSSEIKTLTQSLLDKKILEEANMFELDAEVMYVKDLKLKPSFFQQKSFKIVIVCVFFTLAMTALACVFSNSEGEHKPSKFVLLVKCFDIVENTRDLFTLHEPSTCSISVINGLKSLSFLWIILFHVMLFMYFSLNNKTFAVAYSEQPFYQYVSITPLFVDLLFSISGFLQVHNFMKSEKYLEEIRGSSFGQNARSFGKLVLNRYLRLAPLYLVVAAMTALFTSYIKDVSVFHITDPYDEVCSKYWWRNVLLIQNFFDRKELCLNWSWSLACEMQFYCIVLGLLYTYAKYPEVAKKLVFSGVIVSTAWTYFVGHRLRYQFSFDMVTHTCNELYINPFLRITPYIVGSMAGYYLAKSKGNVKISSETEKLLWNLTVLTFIFCTYSNFERNLSPFYSITLLVGSRVSIAMAVSWMIIASVTCRGVWWSKMLEWKYFQITNRLAYAISLLNPLIIIIVFSLSNYSSYVDPIQMGVLSCGFCVITFLAAIIFSLAFGVPYFKLSILLLRSNIKVA
ncbi:nose resistant to fluoxetine protein 6-like isoform X2 [Eupeodes corollae]|nr:nose resistant to fluoxetine protein 6-like isoform X2 [Eupeodes corollae]XP_055920151.1 nose resistant to fluoxetine protein 6-like isoform X2 [Eupeodes corollae]XP_055920152.1 nose resistant to fluoxetine protein 6-like isoform X2 [Eupeodes corollae]